MSKHLEDRETRIALAILRLTKNFNLLETNLGLTIAHLENPGKSELSYPWLTKSSLDKMLEKLGELLDSEQERASYERSEEYARWRESAQQARGIRNRFVHGLLDFFPQIEDLPVELRQPPWRRESSSNTRMSVQELDDYVLTVERVFKGFMRFREKYKV